jgi:hypothetical protein
VEGRESSSDAIVGGASIPDPEHPTVVEGCGGSVAMAADGTFSLPVAITEPCIVRAVRRNGGAEARGPMRKLTPGEPIEHLRLEVPPMPPWEPPVPPHWLDGGNDGLSNQQRRDQRLAYLRELLDAGTLTKEQASKTRAVVERLEKDRFE